jgi:hypothetical protein
MILNNIGQCDVKYNMILPIKTITLVVKFVTFTAAIILYISDHTLACKFSEQNYQHIIGSTKVYPVYISTCYFPSFSGKRYA